MKKWFKALSVTAVSSVLFATVVGCSSSSSSSGAKSDAGGSSKAEKGQEVSIGVLYPTSGSLAHLGTASMRAVELAAEDINASGGIQSLGGAKIKLEIVDAGDKPETAKSGAERLVQNKNVPAIIGSFASSLSLVASEVTERAKIPFITASISDKLTERNFKNIFQLTPKASTWGPMQIEFAKKYLVEKYGKKPAIAIVYEETAYGTSTAKGLKEAAEKQGLQVLLYEPYQSNLTDAAPLVNKIKASGAEILFPVSYLQDAILIQRTVKQLGVNVVTIGGGAGHVVPEFAKELGPDSNGVISIAAWNQDSKKKDVESIAKRYKEKYGEDMSEQTGTAYAATWLIKHAIEKTASADPQKVRDALAGLKLIETDSGNIMPGGNIEFDATGLNKNVHQVMIQWQDGKSVSIYPEEDAAGKFKN